MNETAWKGHRVGLAAASQAGLQLSALLSLSRVARLWTQNPENSYCIQSQYVRLDETGCVVQLHGWTLGHPM